jgi:very-short-patch-repair endonuclease
MSFDLDARIADWRKSLLDTTKRNRLIKFVAGRTGGVNLVYPSAADLWTRLMPEGRTLTFPWKRELLGLPREIVDANTLAVDVDPHRGVAQSHSEELGRELSTLCLRSPNLRPTHVLTDFTDRQLVARLIRLGRAAREAETDHGVTTLFAAFGFLRWFERAESSDEVLSPLLLVPIRLERETLESSFTLRSIEDDVLPNHCLAELLENQFKIKLPSSKDFALDPEHADCLTGYWAAVRERIQHVPHWSLVESAAIGVFNFQKLAMWEDLGRNIERIKAHPLCRAVAGDSAAVRVTPPNLPTAHDLDRMVPPGEAVHILDADSSQHEAIEAVKRGADLVLDGPPGTGKSQTIANIIAETLAAGKTVLFVSAKVAALEVVKRRLDKCGLGDFCLELHSQKASKKEVVMELGRCLELTPEGIPDVNVEIQELTDSRSRLNEFVAELHKVRLPLGWTAFRVHGELARIESPHNQPSAAGQVTSPLRTAGRSRLSILEPLGKDADYVRKGGEILARLGDCHAVLDEPGGHPWSNCKLIAYSQTIRDDAVHALTQFSNAIPAAHQAASAFEALGVATAPLTIPEWRSAEAIAMRVLAAPLFPPDLFRGDPHATAQARLELDRATREARTHGGQLPEFDPAHVRNITSPDEVTLKPEREFLVSAALLTGRERLVTLTRLRFAIQKLCEQARSADALGRELARILRLGRAPRFEEFALLAELAERMARTPGIPLSWWDPTRRAELLAAVSRASEDERAALAQRSTLVARLAPQALATESSPLAREAGEASQSFWHWLPWSRWARLRKSVLAWYLTGLPAGASVRADIVELATYHLRLDSAWQIATAYKAELLVDAVGKTDWAASAQGLNDIPRLENWTAAPDLRVLLGPGGKLERKQLQELAESLGHSITEFVAGWQILLKDLIVADPSRLLQNTTTELLDWLERGGVAIEKEAGVLARVVSLLAAGKDIPAGLLMERVTHLKQLIEARSRLVAAATILQEERSPEALERLDHAEPAAVAKAFLELLSAGLPALTESFVKTLTDRGARDRLAAIARDSAAAHTAFDKAWDRITTDLFDPDKTCSTNRILHKTALADLQTWADQRVGDSERLAEWARFLLVEKDAQAFGVGQIIDEVRSGDYAPAAAANAFRSRFYRLWLDALHQQVPVLGSFTGTGQDRLIARFAELDRLAIRSTPARVRNELLTHPERPQSPEAAPETSELGILRREVHKKQRHLPLRRLFTQIPWVLPRIKPCLMMSPLAVSTFLDTPDLVFDLVIFDEASQVRPHDAICAIYRGRQLVVGGDPKQLPPTDFFNRSDEDDDEATTDEGAFASYESLLDVCLSRGLTRKWLRWHYRSQRESLIAFSNRYFYESRLITFPSADEATSPAIGFEKVAAGRFKDGVNPIEARRVATLVLEHAQTLPQRTLGVIAFSQRQQERILDELEVLRRQNPASEPFFADTGAEPFFVKNLENVQGDERDVILLAVGYGPDESGKVAMRFGPLNQHGGERRLNVAITRARRAMKVVTSMSAADIDLSRTRAEGVRLLRAFLEVAEQGLATAATPLDPHDGETASPLEQEIAAELVRRGLSVHRRIGCGGFRVALAITDSPQGGKYLLGIECDGATYQSAATARDRDRLRQAVLEGLGWRLVRIWSTDWVRDRDKQVKRILAALQEASRAKPVSAPRELEFKTTPVPKKRAAKPSEYEEIEAVPDVAVTESIMATLLAYGSLSAEELTSSVSRRLGFKRTGPKIRDRVIAGINDLVASGRLQLTDDSRVRFSPGSTTPAPAIATEKTPSAASPAEAKTTTGP